MKAAWAERLAWPAIYLGLASIGLGLSLRRFADAAPGWILIAAGMVLVAIGICFIWLRSRTADDRH